MGSSKFVSREQAMSVLGVSMRTLYRYVQRGILKAEFRGRHMFVDEDSLLLLRKGKHDLLSSPMNQTIIATLLTRIQILETHMATVMRILNVRYDPLNLTLPEYEHFYHAADQQSREGWPPHMEEQWSEFFLRLKVEDLEKLEAIVKDKHPWRPFLRLAATMHINPWNKDLRDLFAAGRNSIQQVASVWCVLKEESPKTFDILLEKDAAPFKKLVNRMEKQQA